MTLRQMQMVMGQASGAIEVVVDNSSVQGVFSFGGYAFPILLACSRPDLTLQVRDAAGDTEIFRQPTLATGSRVVSVERVDGTDFDSGGSGYVNAGSPTAITSFCSHGRWETNAGVSRTVSRTTRIYVREDNAPTYTILEIWEYSLTAIFTG
jgi:hypothetical protein